MLLSAAVPATLDPTLAQKTERRSGGSKLHHDKEDWCPPTPMSNHVMRQVNTANQRNAEDVRVVTLRSIKKDVPCGSGSRRGRKTLFGDIYYEID